MKYAIISDIHANESALRRVLADAAANGVEKTVCLGDVVGYGPLPAETIALVRGSAEITLAGNHDDAVSGRLDPAAFIDLAGDAVERHREAIAPEALEWLKSLPYIAEFDGAVAAHGDVFDPEKFYYIEEEKDAEANFGATGAQIIFVGHTHVPALFVTGRSGAVYKTEPQDFVAEAHKRYVVNPGSVGFPREMNGSCFSSYVIYDSAEKTVSFRYLPFQVSSVMQRGRNPRRIRKIFIAAIAALAAAGAALCTFLLTPTAQETRDAAIETKSIPIDSDLRNVRANVVLEKGSAPVTLKIRFVGADGNPVAVESATVKKSSRKEFPIPVGARRAEFSLLRTTPEGKVAVESFVPSASVK
jgi:predicted phosphodiesterase